MGDRDRDRRIEEQIEEHRDTEWKTDEKTANGEVSYGRVNISDVQIEGFCRHLPTSSIEPDRMCCGNELKMKSLVTAHGKNPQTFRAVF